MLWMQEIGVPLTGESLGALFKNNTSIRRDFFDRLESLEVLALDYINLTGWMFLTQLQDSAQLRNLSCMSCNLVGPLPSFLGKLSSLSNLKLSENNLTGEIWARV
jgi:hypothetical protein